MGSLYRKMAMPPLLIIYFTFLHSLGVVQSIVLYAWSNSFNTMYKIDVRIRTYVYTIRSLYSYVLT